MSPVVTSINSIKELILLGTGNYFAALVCAVIDTAVETHYGVVNDANMMIMSFSLYEGNADPRNLIFSRPEQLHWWLNGFRPDVDDIPAEKLTMKGSITFLDSTMAQQFYSHLKVSSSSRGAMANDFSATFNGARIDFTWGVIKC